MHIVIQSSWRKKLEEYDEIPKIHILRSNMIECSL